MTVRFEMISIENLRRIADGCARLRGRFEAREDAAGLYTLMPLEKLPQLWEAWENPYGTLREALGLTLDPNALELGAYPWPLNAADAILAEYTVALPELHDLASAPARMLVQVPAFAAEAAAQALAALRQHYTAPLHTFEERLLAQIAGAFIAFLADDVLVDTHPSGPALAALVERTVGGSAAPAVARVLRRFVLEPRASATAPELGTISEGFWEYSISPAPTGLTGKSIVSTCSTRREAQAMLSTVNRLNATNPYTQGSAAPTYRIVRRYVGPWLPLEEED
jgi:hypothetical protein